MSDLYRTFVSGFCSHIDAVEVSGAGEGSLKGLTFAVKDIIDVAGVVTGAGNPDWYASHDPAPGMPPRYSGFSMPVPVLSARPSPRSSPTG